MMGRQRAHVLPVNRVEGDLKLHLEITDGVVTDAWAAGAMYRGFENILKGRGPLDGLVITPRICGICTTAHLTAAARALDSIHSVTIPDNALRARNAALMVETIQNDARHANLLFMADFANPRFKDHPLYPAAVDRYAPMRGRRAVDCMEKTRALLEIVAILGGQWPHSSFMIPGGVVSVPSGNDINQCRHLVRRYRQWYEDRVLGCRIDRWRAVRSAADLWEWLDEEPAREEGDVGFFIRFARAAGLQKLGASVGNYISFGGLDLPLDTAVTAPGPSLIPAGFARGESVSSMEQERIAEEIDHSWFTGQQGPRHPSEGVTRPYAAGEEGARYSWSKAPRYDGLPAETGPLAQRMVAGDPLFADLSATEGAGLFARQLARMTRPALMLTALETWLAEMGRGEGNFFNEYREVQEGEGYGLVEAPRGALGHWMRVANGRIDSYQVITPTAWNASPRDGRHERGPCEAALIGTPVADPDDPVEAGMVIRSFDPCLVCTVH